MTLTRRTVEHVFGTLKKWMSSTRFLTRRLEHVGTEMSLDVLAYNLEQVMQILGSLVGVEMALHGSPYEDPRSVLAGRKAA